MGCCASNRVDIVRQEKLDADGKPDVEGPMISSKAPRKRVSKSKVGSRDDVSREEKEKPVHRQHTDPDTTRNDVTDRTRSLNHHKDTSQDVSEDGKPGNNNDVGVADTSPDVTEDGKPDVGPMISSKAPKKRMSKSKVGSRDDVSREEKEKPVHRQHTDPDTTRNDVTDRTRSLNHHKDTSQDVSEGTNRSGSGLSPLSPPRRKKSDLIPNLAVFKELDKFVRNTPKSASTSVEALACHLTSKCKTDLDKIRAIFCWIAFNISYDTKSFFSGAISRGDAASVLQSGNAVCQGYAELLQGLCKVAGIPCLLVSGIDKGYGYDPEDVFTADSKTTHAWNLVLVKGEWRPLDSTWGAGHLEQDGTFRREFDEHWFLTDPEEFVDKHFPLINRNLRESMKYQLLTKPLSISEFSAAVPITSHAHTLGLQLITHKQAIIEVECDVTIKIKATRTPLESVSVTLLKPGSQEQIKGSVLASLSDDGTCSIYIRPPAVATYSLKIFGRGPRDMNNIGPDTLPSLIDHVIRCIKSHPDKEPFPDESGLWGIRIPTAYECGLKKVKAVPFKYNAKDGKVKVTLALNRLTNLSTKLKHAQNLPEDLKEFTFIEYTEEEATVTARLSKCGYYLLQLFAGPPESISLEHVANFLLYADKGRGQCQPFPRVFQSEYRHKARLLQPLERAVPPGEATLYRVYAPALGKVTVGDTKMEMKNDGVWEAEVTPQKDATDVTIYAAEDKNATSLNGLYKFTVA